jgi:mono/diheme cytochrome c family protein
VRRLGNDRSQSEQSSHEGKRNMAWFSTSNALRKRLKPAYPAWAACLAAIAVSAQSAAAETTLERGKYLVNTILACGNCHTPKNPDGRAILDKDLSGGTWFTAPPFNATAANITPDTETGIGAWSDADIRRALTEGVRPAAARLSGVPLAAIMPANYYKALLPGDLDAIVAYLRSVKPVHNEVTAPVYKLPVQRTAYPDAEKGFTEASLRDPVRRGAYLATIGHCMECHSTFSRGSLDFVNGLGAGGRRFAPDEVHGFGEDWKGAVAPNITSHPVKGIGAWTDDEIKRAITKGIARDGRKLQAPMAFAWYAGMKDEDVSAIVAWLRTVPPHE